MNVAADSVFSARITTTTGGVGDNSATWRRSAFELELRGKGATWQATYLLPPMEAAPLAGSIDSLASRMIQDEQGIQALGSGGTRLFSTKEAGLAPGAFDAIDELGPEARAAYDRLSRTQRGPAGSGSKLLAGLLLGRESGARRAALLQRYRPVVANGVERLVTEPIPGTLHELRLDPIHGGVLEDNLVVGGALVSRTLRSYAPLGADQWVLTRLRSEFVDPRSRKRMFAELVVEQPTLR